MRIFVLFLSVSLGALLLLAACDRVLVPTSASSTSVPPIDLAPDVLAIYHKSGGVAGIDQVLTVYQGGLLELGTRGVNPRALKVNQELLLPLRSTLEQQGFGDLEPEYTAAGADLITYTITARDSGGNFKTVITTDAADHPAYLGLLIGMFEQLRSIVEKNGKRLGVKWVSLNSTIRVSYTDLTQGTIHATDKSRAGD